MAFEPFNYGNVLAQGEGIKGARLQNQLAQQQLNPNSTRNQMLNEQLKGQQLSNQQGQIKIDDANRIGAIKDLITGVDQVIANPALSGQIAQQFNQKYGTDFTPTGDPNQDRQGAIQLKDELIKSLNALQNKEGFTLTPGQQRFDAQGNPVASVAPKVDISSTRKDYIIAKKEGYPGSFLDYQKELKAAGKTEINLGLTEGQKQVDKDFAKEYVQFKATGGFADINKQIQQLEEVQQALASGENLTGPITGNTPDFMLNIINPEARSARDAVEEVVQRNLRLILGAQFTEKEGERLIARAYNPKLGEEENLKRVTRLINQIKEAAQAKMAAVDYFEKNGTLQGFTGKQWSIDDFNPEASGGWTIEEVK